MAANDAYLPDHVTLSGGTATFDGSAGATGAAAINEAMGGTDAEVYVEGSTDGGSTWTEIAQLSDSEGNTTFASDWHSQFNRIMVESGKRRLKISDVGSGGEVAVSGDERGASN